jgi:hypothetical protein
MQREERLSLYCPEAKRVQAAIGGRETDRFPDVELIETLEQPLYFDARQESGFYYTLFEVTDNGCSRPATPLSPAFKLTLRLAEPLGGQSLPLRAHRSTSTSSAEATVV